MNGKTWGVFIAIVVTILGGMVYLSVTHRLDISDIAKDQLTKIIPAEKRNGDIQELTSRKLRSLNTVIINVRVVALLHHALNQLSKSTKIMCN